MANEKPNIYLYLPTVIFLELVLQNFGPYSGRQVINLDPRENGDRPIILLGGMNGGGKTTLLDAIRLALYGHRAQCSTRGNLSYDNFLKQCVNSQAQPFEKTQIELAFEHIENAQPLKYRIVRTWSKNPKDGKDSLGIFSEEDKTWGIDSLVSIWDEYIENILPLGISNLFLFDGEQVKELAEQETPPQIVVEAISGLLGLELAERLADDLEILVNRKRKELADTKDLVNLEEIEQKLRQDQEQHNVEIKVVASLEEKLKEAESQSSEALDKFISEGGKIAGDRSQLEKQQKQKTAEIESVRSYMCELAADILPLALIQPLLSQVQITAEKEIYHQQAKLALDILQERDKRLVDKITQLGILEEQLDKIKFLIHEENRAIELEKEELWLLADAENINLLNKINSYYLETARIAVQKQIELLKNKQEEIDTVERKLQTAASPEAYQKLENTLRQAQNQVAEAKAANLTAQRRVIELAAAIEKSKKDLQQYGEQTIERHNKEHIITASAKVQETLKLFRKRLTLKKLNKLEVEVTECFRYLLHKSDLVHRVAIDTHNFSLSLYDLQSLPVAKHRLSAGEKQLLAIAFLWGLARVSGYRLPVAIDTPLGRLDSSHRSNLVERYFPSASHQVILLSTDTEIGEKEVQTLRQNEVIAREYLLKYDSSTRQTNIEPGYFC